MRSSGQRRTRLLAAGAVLTALGGVIGFTQFASAADTDNSTRAGESGRGKVVGNNLTILTDTCVDSQLQAHDGFQRGDRCVSTEFGEVGVAANNPTLLITQAPRDVTVGAPFQLRISTRNLIRDRFLAAGQGGYYVESSVLQNGLVRGHFHTACRMLTSTNEAPESAPVPAFFVATEDSRGGADPDTVTIQVPGLPQEGTAQCSSWAGDGSHRIPMMERANQTPALDSVRITVRAAGNNGGGQNGGGQNGGGQNGGGQNGGGNNGGGQNGGGNNGGGQNGGGNDTNSGEVTPTPTATATGKPASTKPATAKPNNTTVTATPRATVTTTDREDEEEATTSGKTSTPKATATARPTKTSDSSESEESATESETTAPATKTTKKSTTNTEFDQPDPEATDTDGPALANDPGDGAPDPESTGDTLAEPPAQAGPTSLISSNLAWIGGGAVTVLIGLLIAAFLRTRPRNNWR
ncbi:hypothetical protein Ait01nite_094280 [Actinoplanes italicus]|uniref:hypothetical protein n=1 Tax=Actinoplanes italicus TaxID=113567 RepID=UPI001942E207|nr:hypothetical protein Ait01nite_094280 [Actinoplanes italicus]